MPKNREQRLLSDLAAMEADYLHGKDRFEAFLDRWGPTIADIQTALTDDFLSDYAVQCISDTFSTVLAPAAIVHQAISEAESAIVNDVADALEDLALFVPDDNDTFVDDPQPPNHLQDWLVANICSPFVTSTSLSPDFLTLIDMTQGSFSSWLMDAREAIGWNRLLKQFANGDHRTMQKLCYIVFTGAATGPKTLQKTAQAARSQFEDMKAEIERFCEPPMPAWMEEAQRRIQEIKMRPEEDWDGYDEWDDDDDEESLFEPDEEPARCEHKSPGILSFPLDCKDLEGSTKCQPLPSPDKSIKEEITEIRLEKDAELPCPSKSENECPTGITCSDLSFSPPPVTQCRYIGSKRKLDEYIESHTTPSIFRNQITVPAHKQHEPSSNAIILPTMRDILDKCIEERPIKRTRHESPEIGSNDEDTENLSLVQASDASNPELLHASSPVPSCATSPVSPASSTSGSESGSPYNPPLSPPNLSSPSSSPTPDSYPTVNSAHISSPNNVASIPSPLGFDASAAICRSFHQNRLDSDTNQYLDTLESHTHQHPSLQGLETLEQTPQTQLLAVPMHSMRPQTSISTSNYTSPIIDLPSKVATVDMPVYQFEKIANRSSSCGIPHQVQINSLNQSSDHVNDGHSSNFNHERLSMHRKRKRGNDQHKATIHPVQSPALYKAESLPCTKDRRPKYRYKSRDPDGRPVKTLVFPSLPSPMIDTTTATTPPSSSFMAKHLDGDSFRPFKRARQHRGDVPPSRIT